jgi:hypothetical protein
MSKDEEMSEGTDKHSTSDVNFAAYLAYKEVAMLGTSVTQENRRNRVWFEFKLSSDDFKLHKDAYFGHMEDSKVIAHKFFQERERMYSLMIQVRNSSNGD